MASPATNYATRAAVERAVAAARAAKIAVGGIELAPDGTIRILTASNSNVPTGNAFDDWKQARLGG